MAEFGGDPKESLLGGLDFENVRSVNGAGCLSTHGEGDVTLPFSECNRRVSSQAVFS